MVERFEENNGKYAYVSLAQVKDYLSISSNTQDARLSNLINYATGVIEHYIGQEVLANTYTEIFDGGTSSVFVSRLPLSNVYQVSEFDGIDNIILADPTTIGTPVISSNDGISFTFRNNAKLTNKVKKFGASSLQLGVSDYITSNVPEQLRLEESNFTIEAFIRIDDSTLQDNTLLSISTDSSNYLEFRTANQYGLAFEANVDGTSTTVLGSNTSIESQQFAKRRWAHVAITRDLDNEKLYLHYNGNTIADTSFVVSNLTFTTSLAIGTTFKGYMDELRVSSIARYTNNFSIPDQRFRPDDDTVMLVHFDGKHNATSIADVHSLENEYSYSRDIGEITRDTGSVNIRGSYPVQRQSYPALTLSGPGTFAPYPSGIKITYRAGYELSDVPYDLQVVTLDFIKMLYKQDQEKKGFSFEGESGDKYSLAGTFPPHIRRVLDLYRIIN